MISHKVKVIVKNAKAEQFYNFMINPNDKQYSEWWPGEHLQFHIRKRGKINHLGDILFMDEYIGGKGRRLKGFAEVVCAKKPNKIKWQMRKFGIRLPVFVTLELQDIDMGLQVKHTIEIGYSGLGSLLDPFIRLYFNKSYQKALTKHCKIEWPRLAKYLDKEH